MINEKQKSNLEVVDRFINFRKKKREDGNDFNLDEIEKIVFPELEPFLERIAKISQTWNPVEIVTAENAIEEKNKFLNSWIENGDASNPQFVYEIQRKDQNQFINARKELLELMRKIIDLAKSMKKEKDHNRVAYIKYLACLLAIAKIKDDLTTIEMVRGITVKDDNITALALKQKYGDLDQALIAEAEKIYQQEISNEREKPVQETTYLSVEEQRWLIETTFTCDQYQEAFVWALRQYGIYAENPGDFGFLVRIDEKATSIDVRDKNASGKPEIVIPKFAAETKSRNGKNLLSLIGHEIEGHARQSMNGSRLFKFGGGALKIDAESAYEGLAKLIDYQYEKDFFNEQGEPSSYYVKAIEMAQKGKSFQEVFSEILKLKTSAAGLAEPTEQLIKSTWLPVYRVFRGSTDPENKSGYAMPKDKAYLEGTLIARQLQQSGYDEYNQLAVTAGGGLKLLGLFNVKAEDVPYPFLSLQKKYWEEILKPRFETEK